LNQLTKSIDNKNNFIKLNNKFHINKSNDKISLKSLYSKTKQFVNKSTEKNHLNQILNNMTRNITFLNQKNYTISDNYLDDGLPIINQSAESGSSPSPDVVIPKVDIDLISNEVNNAYNFVYESQRGERELRITRTSKDKVDIVDDSITIPMIDSSTTSIYTNTLDLNDLINHANTPGISAKADVTFLYSTDNNIICGGDISFNAFDIDSDGNVIKDNMIFNKEKVRVEYINGIIRIFPTSNDINECILSDVIITYGNLKK
jgi:hypothetical protein